jgi:hypothetical protein
MLAAAQPYPGASSVLVDELDPRRLKCAFYHLQRRAAWPSYFILQLVDCDHADTCPRCKFLLAPVKEPSSCSAL